MPCDWDRYASVAYQVLAAEEEAENADDDTY